jgi:hypothetical protein
LSSITLLKENVLEHVFSILSTYYFSSILSSFPSVGVPRQSLYCRFFRSITNLRGSCPGGMYQGVCTFGSNAGSANCDGTVRRVSRPWLFISGIFSTLGVSPSVDAAHLISRLQIYSKINSYLQGLVEFRTCRVVQRRRVLVQNVGKVSLLLWLKATHICGRSTYTPF